MTDEEIFSLKAAFSTIDGQKALEILRKISGVDRVCYYAQNEREQAYFLGKIDFFRAIQNALDENRTKAKHVRRKQSSE